MKTILVIVSDLHVNSAMGLCSPSPKYQDKGSYKPNKSQQWLLQKWESFWTYVAARKHLLNAQVCTVINGDIVDVNTHDRASLISTTKSEIVDNAVNVLARLDEVSDKVLTVSGTPSHTGQGSELEDLVAMMYRYDKPVHALDLEINSLRFDITHHGYMSKLPWTRFNPLFRKADEMLVDYVTRGKDIPDVAIRSHNHQFGDTGRNKMIRVIQTPCWQLPTSYSFKMDYSSLPDIGGLVFEIEDGKYTMTEKLYKIPEEEPTRVVF